MADVMRNLGLVPNGGNFRNITARVRNAGLDTTHFGGRLRKRCEEVPTDTLAELVRTSTSYARVLERLGLPVAGRALNELQARVTSLGLDTAHMRGPGWSRGETKTSNPSVARASRTLRVADDEVFVENSHYVKGPPIVERLIEKGWAYACAICEINEWCGRKLVLHLDHINGIHNDNRLANLRLLCPNCHSQTDTYCRRLSGRASESLGLCYTFSGCERGGIW